MSTLKETITISSRYTVCMRYQGSRVANIGLGWIITPCLISLVVDQPRAMVPVILRAAVSLTSSFRRAWLQAELTNVTTHKSCTSLLACSGSFLRALTSSRNAFATSSTWSARLILPWRRKRIATGLDDIDSLSLFSESASSKAKTLSVMPAMTIVCFDIGGYIRGWMKFKGGEGRRSTQINGDYS